MTAVDLLLVATLLAALLAWWIPALPGRRSLLALASTLALGAGLYAAWDDRWQAGVGAFAGFSLLLGACLRRKPERGLPFRTGSLYGLLVLLAIAALYLFPVAPLPAPSGPYAAVSYTHLTPPASELSLIPGVAGSIKKKNKKNNKKYKIE
ncbi:hypothetical protein KZ848_33340 [Pseudomonas aeruginosa]|nr:hypothetical protein [Pseudomonas aeruginosa]MBW6280734.1 hypothetical protein [Pseudomonas aeruginosa]